MKRTWDPRTLRVVNHTRYDARAIRRILAACLRSFGMKVRGYVRIAYSKKLGEPGWHGGRAMLGSLASPGTHMLLTLPRDPKRVSGEEFARVVHHEVLHWRGVQHGDMPPAQKLCLSWWIPSWFTALGPRGFIAHRGPKPPVAPDVRRERKIEHARTMLAKAERKQKLATTLVKRWKRRLDAAERAFAKGQALAGEVREAARPSSSRPK